MGKRLQTKSEKKKIKKNFFLQIFARPDFQWDEEIFISFS